MQGGLSHLRKKRKNRSDRFRQYRYPQPQAPHLPATSLSLSGGFRRTASSGGGGSLSSGWGLPKLLLLRRSPSRDALEGLGCRTHRTSERRAESPLRLVVAKPLRFFLVDHVGHRFLPASLPFSIRMTRRRVSADDAPRFIQLACCMYHLSFWGLTAPPPACFVGPEHPTVARLVRAADCTGNAVRMQPGFQEAPPLGASFVLEIPPRFGAAHLLGNTLFHQALYPPTD